MYVFDYGDAYASHLLYSWLETENDQVGGPRTSWLMEVLISYLKRMVSRFIGALVSTLNFL